jgi:hypothetical protein
MIEVKIKAESDYDDKPYDIFFSNEMTEDNPNFVEMTIIRKIVVEETGEQRDESIIELTVSVDDLIRAVEVYESIMLDRELERARDGKS